ncbi:MAG: tetratricopeptide repeat protein, partial [Desulfobacterales bacterium]|nr:tetratricopeptide repeat protein [Desulfobacterales bacterium]
MAEEGFKRKLTAILSADVIGYSRLMRDNEEATVRDLAAHRVLISDIIQQHHGRVVDSPGDNILAEFASVVDAVNGAIKIQKEIKKSNAGIPEDRHMEFRIGVNLGDVIEEEERIYGDGVNIAARVEGLAAGGGIAISGTVYEHIKEKLSLGYHYLGEQDVKNISEPIRVYRLLTERADAGKMIGEKKPKSKKLRWAASGVIALIALVVAAFAIWNYYFRPSFEPASEEKMVFPLPEKPSIAVLPFDNMSGDPEQEYLCDGITENIITALSKVRNIFVIARDSTFTYKGKPVKIQQVAEELGVQHVLEGSVQKTKGQVRITAQLIDALTGKHLWAERYDRELNDIFAIQDEITKKVITALQVELTEGEHARITERGTKNLDAYLKLLQAWKHTQAINKEDLALARQFTKEALSIDSEYALAYSTLAAVNVLEVYIGASNSPEESLNRAEELAKKALTLDDTLIHAHSMLSLVYIFKRKYDKALTVAEQAVTLGPNDDYAYFMLGTALMHSERFEEAIPNFKKSLRLRPHPLIQCLNNLATSYRFLGRYDEAIATYSKLLKLQPDHLTAHLNLAATYVFAGREEDAHREAEDVMRIDPKFSLDRYAKRIPYRKELVAQLAKAWRKAGLPEHPSLKLPDKPSIAVLPFDNLSKDPEQEYFADGMIDDLITDLSKISGLFVIARNSTFQYKGKAVDVKEVSRELGIRYVLEGSVRKA